jgi:alpha-tubulin suppressor-like RCC1 family protein
MIPVTNIISTLNSIISTGGLSSLELAQVFGAIESLEKYGLGTVESVSRLPPAANNTGRFVFILNESRYVYSNGTTWDITNIYRKPDQSAYAWGLNTSGQLGDITSTNRSSPVSIVGFLIDWIQVSAGGTHSLALRANGTAWAWGVTTNGRLGDNTAAGNRSSPVSVVGGFTDWIQLNAGSTHSLGLRANGSAWAWGLNTNGRLGDGSVTARSSPVSVVGGFVDWIQLSPGEAHSLGVRSNGTAWAWGSALNGRLGDNTIVSKSSPVSVVGGFVDWVQVSAGSTHSLALRANGTAWAWGGAGVGLLGDNTAVSKSSPVSVVGGFTDWIQVSAGTNHSLGLRANGTAWAWGNGTQGRLGDGTTTARSSPVSVVGGFTDWIQLSAGGLHSLGLRANGTAWSWGYAVQGQLGNADISARSSPVSVVGGFTDWIQVSAGSIGNHSLGLKT